MLEVITCMLAGALIGAPAGAVGVVMWLSFLKRDGPPALELSDELTDPHRRLLDPAGEP
jgi:hypothetical protein